jgi:hypothetical protein
MIIVRLGTLFTLNAHDADHLRAIARRATTDATDAISLRDLRMGHDKRALLDSASFDVHPGFPRAIRLSYETPLPSHKASHLIPSGDKPALTEIPPRYHRPLTTFGCIHTKNALVVKHVLD